MRYGYQRVVVVPCFLPMYLLLLLSLSSWRPVLTAYIYLTSLPQCIYAIMIYPKTPSPSSHISLVALPHLHRCRLHLPVSILPLCLFSRISTAMLVRLRLHRCPCLPYPLFRISTASIIILLCLYFSPRPSLPIFSVFLRL